MVPVLERAKTSEFLSPQSFNEAWNGKFFLAAAVQMVTTVGLLIGQIPLLHTVQLGGRLAYSLAAWALIGAKDWVLDVVSYGYKIPFKLQPPGQKRVPSTLQQLEQLGTFCTLIY